MQLYKQGFGLLANEENINGAEVKVVEEREGCEAVVSRMLAGVELAERVRAKFAVTPDEKAMSTYHYSLSFVLNNVTRPADLVAAAEAEKH